MHPGTNKCKGISVVSHCCWQFLTLFVGVIVVAVVGYGFVKMANWMSAYNAIQGLHGYRIDNKYLSVSFKK